MVPTVQSRSQISDEHRLVTAEIPVLLWLVTSSITSWGKRRKQIDTPNPILGRLKNLGQNIEPLELGIADTFMLLPEPNCSRIENEHSNQVCLPIRNHVVRSGAMSKLCNSVRARVDKGMGNRNRRMPVSVTRKTTRRCIKL